MLSLSSKLSHSRHVEARSDGDEQRALWEILWMFSDSRSPRLAAHQFLSAHEENVRENALVIQRVLSWKRPRVPLLNRVANSIDEENVVNVWIWKEKHPEKWMRSLEIIVLERKRRGKSVAY